MCARERHVSECFRTHDIYVIKCTDLTYIIRVQFRRSLEYTMNTHTHTHTHGVVVKYNQRKGTFGIRYQGFDRRMDVEDVDMSTLEDIRWRT